MKNFLAIALFSAMILSATENIALPKPAISQEASLAAALANRQSHREFGGGELTPQQLSNLLWAAYGQNRADGKLTVPAALNRHAFDLYVLTAKGVTRYDQKANALIPVCDKDLRVMAEGRKTLGPAAAAVILLVAKTDIFSANGDFYLGVEAGAICQDIYLYAATAKLNALCCGSLDAAGLTKALSLPANQKPVLTMVVGPAPEK